MGHVEALEAERRVGEPERFLDVGEGLGSRGEVSGPARRVLHEGAVRVLPHGFGEGRLVTALRGAHLHGAALAPLAPPGRQHLLQGCDVVGKGGHDDLAGRHQLVVGVLQGGVDEVAEAHVELGVDHPPPHAADAPAAHREQLHGGRELVVRDAEHVSVDVVSEHHGALFERRLEGPDLVADARGRLVIEFGRRLAHLFLEPAHV